MLEPEVTVGLSITGALTPAGLGHLGINSLIRPASSIGSFLEARIFIMTHTLACLPMHLGNPAISDIVLRQEEVRAHL